MLGLSIKGLSYYIPEGRRTNDEVIEKIIKENEGNLSPEDLDFLAYGYKKKLEFLEIKTRAYGKDLGKDGAVQMAIKVCQSAIEKAGLKPEDIDCIMVSSTCNPFREPSFAIMLAHQLGINQGDFFDIGDSCNGFLKSMELASFYVKSGKYENILLVSSESPLELSDALGTNLRMDSVDDADNKVNILFVGSGAGAMVVGKDNGEKVVRHYYEKRESKDWDAALYVVPFIEMPPIRFGERKGGSWSDGRAIASGTIKDMPDVIKQGISELGIDLKSVDHVFMHQMGRNITFAILDKLEIDRSKFPINTFQEYGNMGSSNLPVGLALADEQGLLKKGDSILLLGSACGLSYSFVHIVW